MIGFVIGFLAGVFGALVGLGGGVVMVPLLVAWPKLRQHEAHGTSLLAVSATALVGGVTYARAGAVDLAGAAALTVTAMLTARFGARFTKRLDPLSLRRVFGGFLILTALILPFKQHLPHVAEGGAGAFSTAILLLAGALAGFASGLLGIGGGTVMVPALALGAGFPQQLAQGTSLAAMILPSLVGALTHYRLGHVRGDVAPWLLAGITGGAYVGGSLALGLPEGILRGVFALVLLWTGARYVRGRTRGERR